MTRENWKRIALQFIVSNIDLDQETNLSNEGCPSGLSETERTRKVSKIQPLSLAFALQG